VIYYVSPKNTPLGLHWTIKCHKKSLFVWLVYNYTERLLLYIHKKLHGLSNLPFVWLENLASLFHIDVIFRLFQFFLKKKLEIKKSYVFCQRFLKGTVHSKCYVNGNNRKILKICGNFFLINIRIFHINFNVNSPLFL
jgi:hypothetical protein